MISNEYFSHGITINPVDGKWEVRADFRNEASTVGQMRLRCLVDDPVEGAKTLKEDMERLGIRFDRGDCVDPTIYIPGDSENPLFEKAAETIDRVCKALGWRNIYNVRSVLKQAKEEEEMGLPLDPTNPQ